MFLKTSQNSQENTCASVFFLIKLQAETCNFAKKETLAHVFSNEFWEIFKSTFFTEHVWRLLLELWETAELVLPDINLLTTYVPII